jgi:hypothetical protein
MRLWLIIFPIKNALVLGSRQPLDLGLTYPTPLVALGSIVRYLAQLMCGLLSAS